MLDRPGGHAPHAEQMSARQSGVVSPERIFSRSDSRNARSIPASTMPQGSGSAGAPSPRDPAGAIPAPPQASPPPAPHPNHPPRPPTPPPRGGGGREGPAGGGARLRATRHLPAPKSPASGT